MLDTNKRKMILIEHIMKIFMLVILRGLRIKMRRRKKGLAVRPGIYDDHEIVPRGE